jgi:hypothetical protein
MASGEKPCGAARVQFKARSETHARLNEIVAVGAGYRSKGGSGYNIFQVL